MVWQTIYMAAACVITVLKLGLNREGLFALAVTVVLVRIADVDRKTMKIPNVYLLVLFVIFIFSCFWLNDIKFTDRLAGFLCVSMPMLLMSMIIPGSFGGGDIKMMAVCGLLLGPWRIGAAAFISILTGGCYAIFMLTAGKVKIGYRFAFGPYLAFGVWLTMLFGKELVLWYLEQFW